MPNEAISGRYAIFRRDSTTAIWGNHEWDVSAEREPVDGSNAEDGEAAVVVEGMVHIMWNVRILFNRYQNPYDSPINLNFVTNTRITNARLYVYAPVPAVPTGPYWSIPSSLILGVTHRSQIRGRSELELRCQGIGAWVFPTGNVS